MASGRETTRESAESERDAPPDRRRGRYALFALPILVPLVVVLDRLGIDVGAWFTEILNHVESVPPHFVMLAVLLKAGESILTSAAWTHVLRATYPEQKIPHRLVLTGYQSGVALNAVAPVKAGTLANVGILRLNIQGSRVPTLISTFAVNSIAFAAFSLVNILIVVVLFHETLGDHLSGAIQPVRDIVGSYPVLAPVAGIALIAGAILIFRSGRTRLGEIREQLVAGGAILRDPRRYLWCVFLPALGSYTCRLGYTAVFMAAFDIPVTLETVFLMLGAGLASSLLAVTPGGFGVNQAVDVAVMSAYASADVLTAASLTQDVVLKAWNILFGVFLAAAVFGRQGAKTIFRRNGSLAPTDPDLDEIPQPAPALTTTADGSRTTGPGS